MPTGISDLWVAMDRDITAGKASAGGWLLRLAKPVSSCPLFAAIELASLRRAILLRLPVESVPPRRRWPRCKGLEPLALEIGGKSYFGVVLKETRFADVFAALAEDLARRVTEAATPEDQASAFLGQLSRWQKFLITSSEGLNDEAQRGLWGELHFLRDHLLPVLGSGAVSGWKGPQLAHQDFQFELGAVEVKATLAKQPQVVRITSERQLDAAAWPTLLLHVSSLDVRDGGGESLPELVGSIRKLLAADPAIREQLEDKLLLVGYLDAHAERYRDRGYLLRTETSLHVKKGFPMLAERGLPRGIGDVSYGLSVAACARFAIGATMLKKRLAGLTEGKGRAQRRAADGRRKLAS